jgi:hypothetical protein
MRKLPYYTFQFPVPFIMDYFYFFSEHSISYCTSLGHFLTYLMPFMITKPYAINFKVYCKKKVTLNWRVSPNLVYLVMTLCYGVVVGMWWLKSRWWRNSVALKQCYSSTRTQQNVFYLSAVYFRALSETVLDNWRISNTEILEHFQPKALRMIVDTPWYVPNTVIWRDLQTPSVKEEIRRYSSQYSAHPNDLVVNLVEQPDNRRLWRHVPNDLPTEFLV